MEHDRAVHLETARAPFGERPSSFVDCLFEMPEEAVGEPAPEGDRAAGGQLEARLSAHLRAVIGARLRDEAA
jgi:hypothetical protein